MGHNRRVVSALLLVSTLIMAGWTLKAATWQSAGASVDVAWDVESASADAMFQWLRAVHDRDEARLKAVSASADVYELGLAMMRDPSIGFRSGFTRQDLRISVLRWHMAGPSCVVVDHVGDATRILGMMHVGPDVLRLKRVGDAWLLDALAAPYDAPCSVGKEST